MQKTNGTKKKKHPSISIICAPFGAGGPDDSAKDGPEALLNTNIDADLRELGFNVAIIKPTRNLLGFVSNINKSNAKNRIKNIDAIVKINEWLAKVVANELKKHSIPLTIGGDHSLAIGTIAGIGNAISDFGVLWIDRHFDAHSPKNTPSWRAHGMPVARHGAGREIHPAPEADAAI